MYSVSGTKHFIWSWRKATWGDGRMRSMRWAVTLWIRPNESDNDSVYSFERWRCYYLRCHVDVHTHIWARKHFPLLGTPGRTHDCRGKTRTATANFFVSFQHAREQCFVTDCIKRASFLTTYDTNDIHVLTIRLIVQKKQSVRRKGWDMSLSRIFSWMSEEIRTW